MAKMKKILRTVSYTISLLISPSLIAATCDAPSRHLKRRGRNPANSSI